MPPPCLGSPDFTPAGATQPRPSNGQERSQAAPDDPAVAYELGRLAFQTGDYPWAASLLQKAARKQPDQLNVQFDYAEAA